MHPKTEPESSVKIPAAPRAKRPRLLDRLKAFYFTIDLRSLALYRICLACLLINDWFGRWPNLEAFYTSFGILPIESPLGKWGGDFHYSLLDGATGLPMVKFFFGIALISYVMLLFGWRTRFWQVLSFVFYTSIVTRNPMMRDGSDVAMMTFALWALFLPLGERFSVDAILNRMRNGVALHNRLVEPEQLRCAASLAAFAIVWQIGMIYFLTAVSKYGGTWRDGTALYYAWHIDYMARPLGLKLSESSLWLIKTMTWGVVALEYIVAPMLLAPVGQPWLRRAAIIALVSMHLGIWFTMDIGHFPFVMMGLYPLLLGAEDWAVIRRWALSWSKAVTVYYDDTCGFCQRCCQLIAIADRSRQIEFIGNSQKGAFKHTIPQSELDSTVVVIDMATQRKSTKSAGIAAIFRALPLPFYIFRMIALPGLCVITDRVYDLIARSRYSVSRWLGFNACGIERLTEKPPPAAPPQVAPMVRAWRKALRVMATIAAGLVFVAIFLDNYDYNLAPRFKWKTIPEPRITRAILDSIQIGFVWRLFAPDPFREDGWWVIDGITESREPYDPLTGKAPSWEKPGDLASHFHRFWRKVLEFVTIGANHEYRLEFARYLARKNHREKAPGHRLVRFKIFYILEFTQPPGTPRPFPTEKRLMWEHECFVNPPFK